MDIGTGIAIAGVWIFPTACTFSKYIDGGGWLISVIIALSITGALIW